MSRMRIDLGCAAAALVAGVLLTTEPVQAARPMGPCSESQKTYMRQVAFDVCGPNGGTTYAYCNGMNVNIVSVTCA